MQSTRIRKGIILQMALEPCSSCPSFFTLRSMVNSVYILDATVKLTVFAPMYIHTHTHTRSSHTVLFHFLVGFLIRQARIGRESRKKRNYTDSAVSSDFMFSLVHKLSRESRINYRNIEDLCTLPSLKSDLHL